MNEASFFKEALRLFLKQRSDCEVYRNYLKAIGKSELIPEKFSQFPFLPISFFRTHEVRTDAFREEKIFCSSGTTGSERSRHFVADLRRYRRALLQGFEQAYGPAADWTFLALLPGYLEREDSSLVHMMQELMARSGAADNGFYLHDFPALAARLQSAEAAGRKTLLMGVTFALLDFAAAHPMPLRHTRVMETGGMKGRGEELLRSEVHRRLQAAFLLPGIHSEYGMTELLSQAYAPEGGLYRPSPTLRALVREVQDPFAVAEAGSGVLNFIDLANEDSCAFLATEDLGAVYPDGRFEVSGRVDFSALRGCSLLAL